MDLQLGIGVVLTGVGTILMLVTWSKRKNAYRDRLDRGLRGYLAGASGAGQNQALPQ